MEDQLLELCKNHLGTTGIVIVILLMSCIEVSKIKINPWSGLFRWLGNKCSADTQAKLQETQNSLEEISSQIKKLKREQELKNADDWRWDILDFANSCRNNRRHDKEEWTHVLDQMKKYENYVIEHNIDNAVIEEDTKYLRELYRELLNDNDFL